MRASATPFTPTKSEAVCRTARPQVGEVGKRKRETFVVEKTLSEDSALVEATLERPLGIIFTPDTEVRTR